MHTSIREGFTGAEMKPHREYLIKRLDHILGRLDLGTLFFKSYNLGIDESYIRQVKEQYRGLRRELLDVGRLDEVANIPTRTSSNLILFGC